MTREIHIYFTSGAALVTTYSKYLWDYITDEMNKETKTMTIEGSLVAKHNITYIKRYEWGVQETEKENFANTY